VTALERVLAALDARDSKPRHTGKGFEARCPAHEDDRASLSVSLGNNGSVLVHCFAGCPTEAVVKALGLETKDLFEPQPGKGIADSGQPKPWNRPVKTTYPYHDETGRLLSEVVRFADRKDFRQRRPDPTSTSGWRWNLNGTRCVLYRLPDLLAGIKAGATVYVVEGEKDVDTLRSLGLVATCNPMGAGKWDDSFAESLSGARVVILPDNDEPGRRHADTVARSLAGKAASVRVLNLDNLRPKGDVSDWIDARHTRDELLALAEATSARTDPPRAPSQAERAAPAKALVPAATDHKTPATENAAALLRDVRALIHRFVVLTPEQEVAVTLWTLHTWAIEAAVMSPYLFVSSAVMRAGKTRLLETVELVVRNPWRVVQPSEAVLFRKLGQGNLTLLFDEVDAVFGKKVSDAQEGIRAVLNCGFQRGATVPRVADHGRRIEEFAVFGPKLLAGIGLPPPTVRDRSFVIEMKRKKKTENVSRFRRRDAEALAAPLRGRLESWAASAVDALREARPELPEKLGDRAQDGAEPLLAIADSAGAEWPALARKTLIVLAGEDEGDDDELGVRLLGDVRAVLELLHRTDGEITTAALLAELHAREESPWQKLFKGEPLDARGLARLLRPFGVRPRRLRVGEETVRGYLVSDFLDPIERYLSSDTSSATSATAPRSNAGAGGSVAGDPPQNPPHGAAVLPLFGASGSVADGVAGRGATVLTNKDGPCGAVAGVAGKEPNAADAARMKRVSL
jgi:5S rRNA maturation endonuclease (ribonuclease M5)